jgi:phage-related protein
VSKGRSTGSIGLGDARVKGFVPWIMTIVARLLLWSVGPASAGNDRLGRCLSAVCAGESSRPRAAVLRSSVIKPMALSADSPNAALDAELAELPADMRARLGRICELIEALSLSTVKKPHIRHIRGQLWEIRLKGKAGIARALNVTAKEQRVVIVRAFIKKTEKTPTGEIDLVLQKAKELKP